MAAVDLTSPLITTSKKHSRQPELVIAIQDDNPGSNQSASRNSHSHIHHRRHPQNCDAKQLDSRNPYEFLGSTELSVPPTSTVDPFKNATPSVTGLYEVMKILLCVPIALVRLALFGICLAVGYLATRVALEGWKDKQEPMPKWRCRIMLVTRLCARFILFAFGYHWIRRRGKPASREIAPIVVSNHVSYIEPIFYFYELFPTIVASESHDSMPFVGTIIRAMQVIYVNRFSPASRKNAVNEIKRKASCDKFPRVLLFPEGTTTNGRVLISFQLGAFIPGHPIQPVIVRYPHVHFDQSWGNVSLSKLMFRMFTQFHNFMEIEYLPVIYPLDNKKENAVQFAKRTGHIITTALNVTQTSHSYGDVMLLMKASESRLANPSKYMVEMARVESLFHISSLEAVDFLDIFASMNPDARGRVTCHDFLRVLRLKPCMLSEEIFSFVDVDKTGSITFKQFLFGSAYIMTRPLFRPACELAFSECDAGRNVFFLEHELRNTIRSAIPELNDDEVHEMFNLLDVDNDGKVSKADFLSCLRRNPLLIALFSPSLLRRESLETWRRMLEEIV